MTRFFFRLIAFLPIIALCSFFNPRPFKVEAKYYFDGSDKTYWKKYVPPGHPSKFYNNSGDTLYWCTTKKKIFDDTIKLYRLSQTLFNRYYASEPIKIRGHKLIGAFSSKRYLEGADILFYVDENQGVLQKVYLAPHQLTFCDYFGVKSENPFADDDFHSSLTTKVSFTDTIRINDPNGKIKESLKKLKQ